MLMIQDLHWNYILGCYKSTPLKESHPEIKIRASEMIRKDNRYVDEQHIEIKIWWYELVVKTMIDKETLYFDDRVWALLDKKVLIGSWSLGAFIDFF
jgi:hypothetical protein